MKRKLTKPPPPGSPNAIAAGLNKKAMETPADIQGLPYNQAGYVKGVHWLLVRYWHREISIDQAQAERVLFQVKWLGKNDKLEEKRNEGNNESEESQSVDRGDKEVFGTIQQ